MSQANQSTEESQLPDWGRVLICGGTDWPVLGRKTTKGAAGKIVNEDAPDLPNPHILRSVCNYRMRRVFTSHSSSHAVMLSVAGDAFVLGRNEHGQCGMPIAPTQSAASSSKGSKQNGVDGSSSRSGPAVSEPIKLDRTRHFSPPLPTGEKGDIVHAACGRQHTLLVTRAGSVYSAGGNANGQCGLPRLADIDKFTRIEIAPFIKERDPVVMAAAGITFSLLATESGKVYAIGSSEKGQLGNGRTGEHFISGNKLAFNTHTEPLLVKALVGKHITQIACGQQHAIVMDKEGYVYVWGFGGYGRLGIGNQQDQLVPALVPQFARDNHLTRARQIFAGPTNSAVIDGQTMFWLAGKWKNSGEGSAGQGYMTFKYLPDIMGCKMRKSSLGGVTLFCVADEDPQNRNKVGATMNICWGQNAGNGELGLGLDKPRSATKPLRCETLDGIAILDIAAGQNTTFFIARSMGDAYAELPRYPEAVESSELCLVCGTGSDGQDTALLECEKCENPYHLGCLDPPLSEVPEGEWHCPECLKEAGDWTAPSSTGRKVKAPSSPSKSGRGGRAVAAAADEEEANDEEAPHDEEVGEQVPPTKGARGRPKRVQEPDVVADANAGRKKRRT